MKADQCPVIIEDKTVNPFHAKSIGLPLSRKPVSEWNWRIMEDNYDIITQVGEGTFR